MLVMAEIDGDRTGEGGQRGPALAGTPGAASAKAPLVPPDPGPELDEAAYARVAAVLRVARGLDLAAYKARWTRRRIGLRARARACADGAAYAALLERDPAEVDRLSAALTISVSQFFRNPTTFARIAEVVLPPLFERAGPAGLRVLSVGCASGEEPYSLAILLRERFAKPLARTRVSIQGLDRDEAALERARTAVYDRDRLVEVSAELRARYFTATPAGRFQLSREVRRMVAFRQADVLVPAGLPRGPTDLIFCRNVLIYFARSEQERLLASFEERLAPGGFLVLGKAETLVAADRRRFRTVCPWERIYQRP
jgi:chemotaxis protein methyltransferase CheR